VLDREFNAFQVMSDRLLERLGSDATLPELVAGEEDAGMLVDDLVARTRGRDRYPIRESLAKGGMGEVLRVWDAGLRRHVAMKLLSPEERELRAASRRSARMVRRFLNEAEISARLAHPGVVPVHELGVDPGGKLYFTMEFVEGRTLGECFGLARAGSEGWSRPRALRALLAVCETMAYSHSQGVIHRDLKPENVMVGEFGEVYVLDWGIAKQVGGIDPNDIRLSEEEPATGAGTGLHTMDGVALGTPSYMSPEQAAGRADSMGPHSDVYAIGAMLYVFLTGHAPFQEPGAVTSAKGTLARLQAGAPIPVAERAPDGPPELVAICEKAMHRRPEQRYAGMRELAGDIEAFLDRRVVRAYRTGARAELSSWVRRNARVAALGAAVLVAVVGGLVAISVVQRRANVDLRAAGEEAREGRALAERSAYVANLYAASTNLDAGDVRDAKRRLAAAPSELRGWEWSHLAMRAEASGAVERISDEPLVAAAFEPMGEHVLAVTQDGDLLLASGDGARRTLAPPVAAPVTAMCWGARRGPVVAGLGDGSLAVWPSVDVEPYVFGRVTGTIESLALSWNSTLLVCGLEEGGARRVETWDLGERRRLARRDLPSGARSAAATWIGKPPLVVSEGPGFTVQLWDPATGEVRRELVGLTYNASAFRAHPSGARLAAATWDRTLVTWDVERAEPTWQGTAGWPLLAVDFEPDDAGLVAGGWDKQLYRFDHHGAHLPVARMFGHEDRIAAVQAGPVAGTARSASWDGTLRTWDLTEEAHVKTVLSQDDYVLSTAFSPDGSRLAVTDRAGRVRALDPATGDVLRSYAGLPGAAWSVAWSPDGDLLAAVGGDDPDAPTHGLLVWDADTGELLSTRSAHDDSVRAVRFTRDGERVVTGSLDGSVRLWPARGNAAPVTVRLDNGGVRGLDVHPTAPRLLITGNDHTVTELDLDTADVLRVLTGHEQWVRAVDWSPDGARFVTGGGAYRYSVETEAFVWDAATGAPLFELDGHDLAVLNVSWSPDGSRIATVGEDRTARIWDAHDGALLLTLRTYEHWVRALDWSPDGASLATGGSDGVLHVWRSR
jgi:WD40 repeat protein